MNTISTPEQISKRLEEVMLENNQITQVSLAQAMGISQPAVSTKIKKGTGLSGVQADLLQEKLGISREWLLYGKGEMLYKENGVVAETIESYGETGLSEKEVRQRLKRQMTYYMHEHSLNQQQSCSKLKIDATKFSKMVYGHNAISPDVLMRLCVNGGFNMNYALGNIGEMFIESQETLLQLQQQIIELKRDKENMSSLIEMYREKYEHLQVKRA